MQVPTQQLLLMLSAPSHLITDQTLSLKGILEITKADGTASGIKGLQINNDSGKKETEINWFVRPAAGLTFTPTKVSGYVNRCGTNVKNGIVISAHKANGEVVALGTYYRMASRQGYII